VKVALDPEQIACVKVAFVIVGIGFTVTTKFTGVPIHDVVAGPVGVITYVTVPAEVVEFDNNSEILPEPLALKPVTIPDVNEAVQAYVELATADVGENVDVDPEQIDCVKVAFVTVGISLTTTAYEAVADPPQELLLVTVIVNVTVFPASAKVELYVGVNDVELVIVPLPLCAQVIVPFAEDAPLTVAEAPAHILCVPPAIAEGVPSIVIEVVVFVDGQAPTAGIAYVTV